MSLIIIFLVVLIVALILANVFVRVIKDERKPHYLQAQANSKESVAKEVIPEVITHIENIHEKNAMVAGNLSATNRKLELVNERVANLEKAVSELAEVKLASNNKTMDLEKVDFRISVLEQQIDELKNPKAKENTFYGKKDDPMEAEIRSLVFNSKRKA